MIAFTVQPPLVSGDYFIGCCSFSALVMEDWHEIRNRMFVEVSPVRA